MKQTTLYYREGASDKVYHASIEARGNLFVVNFAYGRRGSTLNTGTKTNSPLDFASAERLYEKLIREKKAKGYTEGATGTPYQQTGFEQTVSGVSPQLLNPVNEDQLERYVKDPNWCMQEKLDGKRLLIRVHDRKAAGINRRGLLTALPESLAAEARAIGRDCLLDGEAVGERYFAFDLLSLDQQPLASSTYEERYRSLAGLIDQHVGQNIAIVSSARTTSEKQALLELLRKEKREGVVFKRLNAPYTAGRPASGGCQLKCKFYATASFMVAAISRAKRSVRIALWEGSELRNCGHVTIPPNYAIPSVGQIVEVRYLYAFAESGAVYQPVYLGARNDVASSGCTQSQLKYKPSAESEDTEDAE